MLIMSISINSQESLSLGIYQDGKLLFIGDDKGNDAGTIDIIARLEMQGKYDGYGYLVIFPQFEYAEIYGNYKRWSANAGYTLSIINRVKITSYASYGWIDRGISFESWGIGGEISYQIGSFEISLLNEYVERQELDKWVYSLYGGVKYNIKLNK